MGLVLADGVRETTSAAPLTGAFTLGGAATSYKTFANGIGDGNITLYSAYDPVTGARERGIGRYTASSNSLSRDVVLSNSLNTTALISFTNSPQVWCDAPAALLGAIIGKNRVINGDDRVNQYGVASVNTDTAFILDRWLMRFANQSTQTLTCSQNAGSTPAGFGFCINAQFGGTGAAPGTTMLASVDHKIEGLNIADFRMGTANAKTFTYSFWDYKSVAGTYAIAFQNGGRTRSYIATYTLANANTWTYVTLTIPGDTTGTWASDNTAGLIISYDLGAGSSNTTNTINSWQTGDFRGYTGSTKLCATTGAVCRLAGRQLEAGGVATSFEYRQYGLELELCRRYYRVYTTSNTTEPIAVMSAFSANQAWGKLLDFGAPMRASPTASYNSIGSFKIWDAAAAVGTTVSGMSLNTSPTALSTNVFNASGAAWTAGQAVVLAQNGASAATFTLLAEL